MTSRTLLVVALLLGSACTAEMGGAGRTREQLDEYTIAKPLAQAWPDALRFLNERGYPPAGADRKLIGLPPMGSWAAAASKGHQTEVSGKRWIADTVDDSTGKRYRIIGVDLGPDSCRIGFFAIREEGVVTSIENPRENMTRDSTAELAFIESLDPAGAKRMRPKDPGFF